VIACRGGSVPFTAVEVEFIPDTAADSKHLAAHGWLF
jgi:hypothetical protein